LKKINDLKDFSECVW